MGLNQNQLFNAQETFEDFKVLLIRYKTILMMQFQNVVIGMKNI